MRRGLWAKIVLAKENIENLLATNRQEMKVELRRLMKKVPEELK